MGIDVGTKRVGIALSDEGRNMAFPEVVFKQDGALVANIVDLIEKKGVGEIVLGHSLDKDGKPNKVHELAESLMLDLTLEVGLPVHLEPELFTTQAALRIQGRNEMTDAAAATLILDAFLTKTKK
jgi:RNase H-fold protein (predicted Holliday junction resolvase)